MRIVTNEKLIQNRARLGRVASLGGLVVLVLGLVASLYPRWLLASLGCLFVGFLLSQVGLYNANRWVKEPRPDQTLVKVLKGFGDRYHLYSYVLPARHVLLAPFGLCVVSPRDQGGKITCEGEKWHHEGSWKRVLFRFFGQEGLGNPTREVRAEVEKLRRFLAQRFPDDDVPIEGVVVFTNPEVDLETENPAVPVLDGTHLKLFLRNLSKEPVSRRAPRARPRYRDSGSDGHQPG